MPTLIDGEEAFHPELLNHPCPHIITHNLLVGNRKELNVSLEKAGRVADFLELGELMCRDALMREESCGGHFREESQTDEGEALRDDENYAYAAAWQHSEDPNEQSWTLHKEALEFEYVKLTQRSYK